jgi:hypothetical protein
MVGPLVGRPRAKITTLIQSQVKSADLMPSSMQEGDKDRHNIATVPRHHNPHRNPTLASPDGNSAHPTAKRPAPPRY